MGHGFPFLYFPETFVDPFDDDKFSTSSSILNSSGRPSNVSNICFFLMLNRFSNRCNLTKIYLDYVCSRSNSPFRSEEHTSELQSRENLVCRLLLEKKKIKTKK